MLWNKKKEHQKRINKIKFDIQLNTKISKEIDNMLEEFLIKNQGLYNDKSHIVRCAIIHFYNFKFKNKENLWYEISKMKDQIADLEKQMRFYKRFYKETNQIDYPTLRKEV